jgi:hypothetical protein
MALRALAIWCLNRGLCVLVGAAFESANCAPQASHWVLEEGLLASHEGQNLGMAGALVIVSMLVRPAIQAAERVCAKFAEDM